MRFKINYPWEDLLERAGTRGYKRDNKGRFASTGSSGGGDKSDNSNKGKTVNGKNKSAEACADDILSQAKQKDAKVTPLLKSLTSKVGGKMEGLEFRIKGKESLVRKIKLEAKNMGIPENEAADMITDALRFTVTFDRKSMVNNVNNVFGELAKQGWQPYDNKMSNYYKPGDAYDGLNTVVQHKDGTRMEVQFHTPESLAIKHEAHKLYEKARVLPPEDPKRKQLNDQMIEMWSNYDRPENWEKLPGRII